MSDLNLDPRQTAIVVIDLQKGIASLPGAPHAGATVVANAAELLAAARGAGATVILVHVGGAPDGADRVQPEADQPMRFAKPPQPDWSEFIPALGQTATDLVILKRQWGAFYGTDLDLQLRRRGLKTIVLCGVATEFGVESTARSAFEHGYQQIFAEDAMTGLTAESHQNAVSKIFPRIGRVRSTAQIVAALQPR